MTTTTTVRGVLSTLSKTLLVLAALAAVAIGGQQATAATIGHFMYGVDDANDIWEINPADQTSTKVVSASALGSGANALGYDTNRNQLLFVDSANGFGYWQRATDTIGTVGGLSLGIATNPANAAFHNDAFYYFEHNSNVLKRANLAYSGSGETATPSVASIDTFAVLGMGPSSGLTTNTFGDIAIDTVNNVLYASTSRGRFYSVNLASPATGFTEIAAAPGNDRSVGMQLSFDVASTTLYGHNYADGNWYTIDTGTGAQTQIVGFNTLPTGKGFRDLGGAAAVPEPSTIGLAAVGLVGGLGYTGLRRRQKAAKAAA